MGQLILTKTDLTTITVIQKNVEVTHLTPFIEAAQDLHIKKLFGVALYESLLADVTLNTVTDTYQATDTKLNNLLNQTRNGLSYWTAYEATVFLWAKITNKGIMLKNSENSTPAAKGDMWEVKKQFRNLAEFYCNELLTFLRDNRNLYPLWREDCEQGNVSNKKYFSGIQFGL